MPNLPILLIPGLNCTAAVFRDVIPALWPSGPVTVANQLEGEGMGGMAAAILRDAPPRFGLLGFSMGGYLAFEILRQAPERVLRLCLLDTSARADAPETTAIRHEKMDKARAGRFEETLDEAFETAVHAAHRGDAALRELCKSMSRENGPEVFVRQQQAIMARPDSRPMLARIAVPTTVIVGDADIITPPDAATEMADGIAGARLVSIARAGHMAVIEQPAAVSAAIAGWAQG